MWDLKVDCVVGDPLTPTFFWSVFAVAGPLEVRTVRQLHPARNQFWAISSAGMDGYENFKRPSRDENLSSYSLALSKIFLMKNLLWGESSPTERNPLLVRSLAIICNWRRTFFWELNQKPRDGKKLKWDKIYRFRQSEIIGVKQQKRWSGVCWKEREILQLMSK